MAEARRWPNWLWIVVGILALPAAYADEEPPDMEFLEYLGSWEEDDQDWVALAGLRSGELEQDAGGGERGEEEAGRHEQTN